MSATQDSSLVYFRIRFTTNVGLESEVLTLVDERMGLRVELRKATEAEVTKHVLKGEPICIATIPKSPTRAIRAWLANQGDPKPGGFEDFALEAHGVLSDASDRALKLARWRTGQRGARSPIKFVTSFEWSADNEHWQPAPMGLHLEFASHVESKITPGILASISELWASDAEEPLARELFLEACSQQGVNPRSALVMAIVAAETAMKQLISTVVPETRWLMENTPSPPLHKMLQDYLPLLATPLRFKGKVLPPPEWLLAAIEKGIMLRNKIVHGRDVAVNSASLSEVLDAVNDLLYLLDAYGGQAWAETSLSVRLRKSLSERL